MPSSNNLRAARTEQGLSQKDLAMMAGVSLRAIIRLEANSRTPHAATIRALAGALDCEPADLFPNERAMPPPPRFPDAVKSTAITRAYDAGRAVGFESGWKRARGGLV